MMPSASIAPRESVRTIGELHTAIRTAAKAVLPDDVLPKVRAVIAEELRKALPLDPDLVLDASLRPKCVETFRRIAEGLTEVANQKS